MKKKLCVLRNQEFCILRVWCPTLAELCLVSLLGLYFCLSERELINFVCFSESSWEKILVKLLYSAWRASKSPKPSIQYETDEVCKLETYKNK